MITKTKKKTFNPMLMNIIIISVAVHLIALLVLGGITIVKYVIPDEAQFEEPPAVVEEVPPPDVKVEIKPQRAQEPMQKLRMRPVANIAVADVTLDLPTMSDSFTVSAGLGGFGGGSLLGNTRGSIGIGMSDINVFGLKARAERVLFVVDASKKMMEDSKGGLNSYNVIKDEIVTMVSNLSAGTLFNVAFYEGSRLSFFKPRTVPAGSDVTAELTTWIAPINANYNRLGLMNATQPALQKIGDSPMTEHLAGENRPANPIADAYLTQLFLEQSIDAVFVISGSFKGFHERISAPLSAADEAKKQQIMASDEYKEKLQLHHQESARLTAVAEAKLKQINAERAKKGLPPQVVSGNLILRMGLKYTHEHPANLLPKSDFISFPQQESYYREVIKTLYSDKGGNPPSINVVLFLAEDEVYPSEQESTLKRYVNFFDGRYRVIRGLKQIKSAQSAADSTNL